MRLTVRLYAGLRERVGLDELALDVPDGATVGDAKVALAAAHPDAAPFDGVRGVLGTAYVEDDAALSADAVLHLLPPVSGGAPDPLDAGVFELSAEPLEPTALLERVGDPECGGTALFVGTTRGTNRGQTVVRLEYEAFEAMTGAEMGRIFEECLARLGPDAPGGEDPSAPGGRRLRMLAVHRVGTVGVGEPSIAIAVASPHRAAAFAACRFLIDALKARVPIWKREVYADGHHWVGERS